MSRLSIVEVARLLLGKPAGHESWEHGGAPGFSHGPLPLSRDVESVNASGLLLYSTRFMLGGQVPVYFPFAAMPGMPDHLLLLLRHHVQTISPHTLFHPGDVLIQAAIEDSLFGRGHVAIVTCGGANVSVIHTHPTRGVVEEPYAMSECACFNPPTIIVKYEDYMTVMTSVLGSGD